MNANKKTLATALITTAAITGLTTGSAAAEPWTIYSDSFSGEQGESLNGQAPDVAPDDEVWAVGGFHSNSGYIYTGNGSVIPGNTASSAVLPMPGGGLDPKLVYTLTASVENHADSNRWIGIGWAQSDNMGSHFASGNLSAPNGLSWMLWRGDDGDGEFLPFAGPNTNDALDSVSVGAGHTATEMRITIDMPAESLLFEYRLDGEADWTTVASAQADPALLDDHNYVGFTANTEEFVMNEFELTAIPEPGSLALLGAGGLMLLTRRRRA